MEFWKLNLREIGVLKIIWELEFWKFVLRIGILEIKLERNLNFENYLRIGVLKIKFKNWSFGKLFENENLKIKFKNLNFEKLFENKSFEI